MKGFSEQVLGMLWVAGAIYLFDMRHWDGSGCFVLSLPGIVSFIAGLFEEASIKASSTPPKDA